MDYEISNNMNLINYLSLSTTQPHHLLLTHCHNDGNDHRELITTSSEELSDRKNDFPAARTSRWNPTPEQITTLEEIYKNGIRTPTTDEIQKIASKLRKYGRIEGKNVFYWFQNHKARERLKRRRCEEGDTNKPHKGMNNLLSSDHGTTEESDQRASKNGKDATWRNVNKEEEQEEEETREIRTLNLFPVIEKEEQTRECREKTKAKVCCNYCYLYEFIPLKN